MREQQVSGLVRGVEIRSHSFTTKEKKSFVIELRHKSPK